MNIYMKCVSLIEFNWFIEQKKKNQRLVETDVYLIPHAAAGWDVLLHLVRSVHVFCTEQSEIDYAGRCEGVCARRITNPTDLFDNWHSSCS